MRKHVHHAFRYGACVLSNPPLRAVSPGVSSSGLTGRQAGNVRLSLAAAVSHGCVFRCRGLGPESRIHLLRTLLTELMRHERIEASWARVDEMRGYAEKEKDLIPKLFQVLAPRYQGQNGGYTRMLQIPNRNKQDRAKMAVIEYKGNCLPPLPLPRRDSSLTLLNQLLQRLRQDQEASIRKSHTAPTPGI